MTPAGTTPGPAEQLDSRFTKNARSTLHMAPLARRNGLRYLPRQPVELERQVNRRAKHNS